MYTANDGVAVSLSDLGLASEYPHPLPELFLCVATTAGDATVRNQREGDDLIRLP